MANLIRTLICLVMIVIWVGAVLSLLIYTGLI